MLLGVRGKGIAGAADLPGGDAPAAARVHAGLLHRRADRPAAARRRRGPLHRGRGGRDAAAARSARRRPAATSSRSPQAAEDAVPGDIDDDMAIVVVRTSPAEPRLVGAHRSRPSRSWSPRPGGSPRRRSVAGAWTPSRPTSPACWSPRWSPTSSCTPRSAAARPRWTGPERRSCPRRSARPQALAGHAGPAARVQPRLEPAGLPPAWRRGAREALPPPPARSSRCGCARGATSVWVEVFDPDLRLPRIRSAGETDEGGRGLYLVDQLATRWGSGRPRTARRSGSRCPSRPRRATADPPPG